MPAWVVKAKMPTPMKPKCAIEVYDDQPLEVVLADRQQRGVDDADHAERQRPRREPARRLGEQRQAVAQDAERADLVQHADQQRGGTGRGRATGVRQPGVEREERRLDREGEEEAEEQPARGAGGRCPPGSASASRRCSRRPPTGRSPRPA